MEGFEDLIKNAHAVLKDTLSKVPDAKLRAEMNAASTKMMKVAEDLKMTPEEKNLEINHLGNKFKMKYGSGDNK